MSFDYIIIKFYNRSFSFLKHSHQYHRKVIFSTTFKRASGQKIEFQKMERSKLLQNLTHVRKIQKALGVIISGFFSLT
jgi:hypothetical protein